jgi:hypothetical protein
MIFYAHDEKHFDPFPYHWKFTGPGKAARHWRYTGTYLVFDSLHSESLTDFHEAKLEDLKNLIRAIFGAEEIEEGGK